MDPLKRIKYLEKKDPKILRQAIIMVFYDNVIGGYRNFIEGIEDEFTDKEKQTIANGIAEKRSNLWEEGTDEEKLEKLEEILIMYDKLDKGEIK
jgi:hypothetical protein